MIGGLLQLIINQRRNSLSNYLLRIGDNDVQISTLLCSANAITLCLLEQREGLLIYLGPQPLKHVFFPVRPLDSVLRMANGESLDEQFANQALIRIAIRFSQQ